MTIQFASVCMGIIFFISGFGTNQVCFSNTLFESHEATALVDVVYPAEWSYRSNVTLNQDNSLTKTGTAVTWDAGGASNNKLSIGNDGWIEFVVNQVTGNHYVAGLSKAKTSLSLNSVLYGFFVANTGVISIYEQGTNRGQVGTGQAGDVLRISREGGSIKYYHNAVLVRTVAGTADGLLIDASLFSGTIPAVTASFSSLRVKGQVGPPSPGASDGSIVLESTGGATPYTYSWSSGETTPSISGKTKGLYTVTVTDADGATSTQTYYLGYKAEWSYRSNVTLNSDNSMTKAGTAAAWDAGGASDNRLRPGGDGWIEFVVNQVMGNHYVAGLSKAKTSLSLSSVWYGFYVATTGTISIYEQGTNRGQIGTIREGDVLRIGREGASIKYYHNGVLVRTVAGTADEVQVDVSLFVGTVPPVTASFSSLRIKGQISPPGPGTSDGSIVLESLGGAAPYTYSWSSGETTSSISSKARGPNAIVVTDAEGATGTQAYNLGYKVEWSYRSNVTLNSDNSMTKTGTAVAWDAGGASDNKLNPGDDGWVEFVVNQVMGNHYGLGLSKTKVSLHINSVWYGFYVATTGTISIYEQGTNRGQIGTIREGDVLRIGREGGNIKYYHNGVLVRTITGTAVELLIDGSLFAGTIPTVTASFGPLRIKGQLNPPSPGPGSSDGSIFLEVVNGAAPYTYSWSSGETTSSISSKARGPYTVVVTDVEGATGTKTYNLGYKTEWSYRSNVTLNPDNSMTKTGTAVAWDAGGSSANKLSADDDGWIEFVVNQVTGNNYTLGLSTVKTSLHRNSIWYGFFITNTGIISIYEQGNDRGQAGIVREGDVLRVGREGANIKYHHNGELVRTIAGTTNELLIDASLFMGTVPAVNASFSFPQPSRTFYSIANGNWHNPATWSLTEGGSAASTYPDEADIVYVKGFTVDVSTAVSCSELYITVTNDPTYVKIDGGSADLKVGNHVIINGASTNDGGPGIIVQNDGQISVQTN